MSLKSATAPCALVTGGTRGIGLTIATALVAAGYEVIVAARNTVGLPAPLQFMSLDITDAQAVRQAIQSLPRLDLLVNNAGLAGANTPDDPDDALWADILATNLTAAWVCSTAALKRLPDQSGRIINIASVLGLSAVPDQPAYCAAKHGLIGLTRSMALHAAARGITVNAICPGWVETEMSAQRFEELGITREEAGAGIPIGRMSTPQEVANLVVFLAGAGAASITGQALVVDGGSSVAA